MLRIKKQFPIKKFVIFSISTLVIGAFATISIINANSSREIAKTSQSEVEQSQQVPASYAAADQSNERKW